MVGLEERNFRLPHDDISLDNLVPGDGFYRRLEERLDLSFLRESVSVHYAAMGRLNVDPVVFFACSWSRRVYPRKMPRVLSVVSVE